MSSEAQQPTTHERIQVAVYANAEQIRDAVELLNERDYPMDMVSMLGKIYSSGDDPLGIYYHTVGERMKGWGKMGAFWGGIWGLLASAAGLFVIPGLGPIMAAGPVVEALATAVGAAAVTGGAMAGAAAVSELAVAMRTAGIPEQELDRLHTLIEEGHYILLFRCHNVDCPEYRRVLSLTHPQELLDLPLGNLIPHPH